MERVGIRNIKNFLSYYLGKVKNGKIIEITDRGKPVAKLVPVETKFPSDIVEILDKKLAVWDGGKPKGALILHSLKEGKSISDIVSEDRR